jgi:AraC family transcriptional regulator, chitin signaling transcriptional activator
MGIMKIFTFLFFILFSSCHAQYTSVWYNTENGLPQNSIKDVIKDKYGFIWIATDNGLVKYDGLHFTVIDKLPVTNLYFESFLGNIANDSIVIYNNYEKEKILIQQRKPGVFKAKTDVYKLLSKQNNIFTKRIVKNVLTNRYYNYVQYFVKLKYGSYTFYKNSIVYKEKDSSPKTISIPFNDEKLYNIFVDHEILYITDPKNRRTYSLHRGQLSIDENPTLFNDPDTKIYWHQTTGQVLLIHHDSIYVLLNENGEKRLKFLVKLKDIGNFSLYSIYYDQDYNKLYIGTGNNGLNIIDLRNFYIAKDNSDFADNIFYDFLPFDKNTIITTDGTEFSHEGIVRKYPFRKKEKYIILYDNKGDIFTRNNGYILRVKKKEQYKKVDSIFINLELDNIFEDKDLYSYSTTDFLKNNFLYIFKNSDFKKPDYVYRFSGFVNTFLRHGSDQVLVGCNNGLYLINLANGKQKIFPNIFVKHTIQTKDGNIWITTNKNGFYLFKNMKLVKMPNDKNGYLASAHSILEDKYGFFWISSNNGLFKVLKKELLQYAENKKALVTYYRFTKKDGLLTNEFNNSSGRILENGEFVFPSMNGFVFFDPDSIKSYYPKEENIYVERAEVNDIIVYFKDELILKNNDKIVEVFIDAPYYANPENLHIEARLEGERNVNWEQLEGSRYLINNLPPGKYVLHLRILLSADGEFIYKTLKLTIEAKFYQTVWFKTLIIMFGILIILLIIKTRTRLLESKNKSLEKIVFEKEDQLKETSKDLETTKEILKNETEYQKKIIETISHDITTPIRYLSDLSKNLYEVDDVQAQRKYLNSIYKSSEELYKFTLTLKEYSNLYKDDQINEENVYSVFELVDIKRNLFQELAKLNDTVIDNEINQDITTNVNKNILSAVIHNLLDNSVKNTKAGIISINANCIDKDIVEIEISDSGIGMSQEQIDYYTSMFDDFYNQEIYVKKYGLGLNMVLHFVRKIGGHISFKKNQPKGTITIIKIKNISL